MIFIMRKEVGRYSGDTGHSYKGKLKQNKTKQDKTGKEQ